MSEYCHNCTCPSCSLITRRKKLEQDRLEEARNRVLSKQQEALKRRVENEMLHRRECAMIWMLVNTASDQLEANQIIQRLAEALLLSPAQVNTRRSEYAKVLTSRASIHDAGSPFMNSKWASIVGTEGTELPDHCGKCGGMKTMGRKCKRCDYKRSRG